MNLDFYAMTPARRAEEALRWCIERKHTTGQLCCVCAEEAIQKTLQGSPGAVWRRRALALVKLLVKRRAMEPKHSREDHECDECTLLAEMGRDREGVVQNLHRTIETLNQWEEEERREERSLEKARQDDPVDSDGLCVICHAAPSRFSMRCEKCYAALVAGAEKTGHVCAKCGAVQPPMSPRTFGVCQQCGESFSYHASVCECGLPLTAAMHICRPPTRLPENRYCVKCGRRVEAADAAHVYTCEGKKGDSANPAPFID